MKSIILIRHAKSDWNSPVIDKNRILTDNGIRNIKKIAIEAKKYLPENFTIISSTANRASETALLFCNQILINENKIQFNDELYTFDENQLEKEIKKCDNNIENLILFGHNEAITNFVNKFGDKYIANVPTAGFVQLKFEQNSWKDINKGKMIRTIFPKEI
ncbi:MAG: histidine phosphatase family protein [Flavobacterium sp.]|uniref:SixA phosphatase family protein n=1 Tax=Flavobacterium sp. TaxID=239 RepID=UPI0032668AE9